MRSVSHIVAVEIAHSVKKETWTKAFFKTIVHRVDDITEILSLYKLWYGKPYPNCLKKGLRAAFSKFNDYQISKYKGEKKDFKLVDSVNILHPISTETNSKSLKLLVENKLVNDETWETQSTKIGQNIKDEKEKQLAQTEMWNKLIEEKKIGYFALLRNLRNIIKTNDAKVITNACQLLVDEKLIKNSLVFLFDILLFLIL